jgi:hypothetical protein
MTMRTLLLIALLLLLLALGSYCLFFPRSVQAIASRAVAMGVTARSATLKAHIESNSDLVVVRAVGLVAYAMCALLIVGLFSGGSR